MSADVNQPKHCSISEPTTHQAAASQAARRTPMHAAHPPHASHAQCTLPLAHCTLLLLLLLALLLALCCCRAGRPCLRGGHIHAGGAALRGGWAGRCCCWCPGVEGVRGARAARIMRGWQCVRVRVCVRMCVHACTHVQGGAARAQEAACRAAELECCRLVLQCEALRLSLTRIGCQYRAFHSWLLKTGGGSVHCRASGLPAACVCTVCACQGQHSPVQLQRVRHWTCPRRMCFTFEPCDVTACAPPFFSQCCCWKRSRRRPAAPRRPPTTQRR